MSTVLFQPERLRLARDVEKVSQTALAGAIGVTPAAISQFESGETNPSEDKVAAMADALDVPTSFLYLPMVDMHEGFFRSLRKSTVVERRWARSMAHLVHDLATQPGGASDLAPLDLPLSRVETFDPDAEQVVEAARLVRRSWNVPAGPIDDVVALLEEHGILVVRMPMGSADVDAFSLPFGERPVVVLSNNKSDRGRSRFDAAHELGHLVMHGTSVWGVKEVEAQAHRFAAEFLMPEADIRHELPSTADWARLFELKQRWHVSLAALLMRAKTLGVMSPSAYTTAMKGISARGWRRVEPIPLGAPEGPRRTTALLDVARKDADWFPRALLPALEGLTVE
ncbi:XRE family transcriptional regulator [Nocardioides sp. 1609]|uniref:XRE family transcriptional regulator n=1 Tax=Nocardioides sp. 1609 TaxID=2508327 RepID=UPI00107049A3|nr:XRE family transcriptional regulator [Nocardioides sp. 1609]